ncbi:flagellar transcriptional regulator FlhD [Sedimenticola selenatireducens]|uniref:flagellar transcriptional regulator FlhD n=1 Tax=Sedimenticola selenatireducens TaxID=191960 RepID=UPI0004904DBF|nr:flagellar transcriptional regulator FlhD [Sedimenticola selenatireducens]
MPASDPDILDLNLSWLFKAREMARSNQETAAVVLGLDRSVVIRIARLSLQDMNAIARSKVMVFHPRFHPKFWSETLGNRSWAAYAVQIQTLLMAADEATQR